MKRFFLNALFIGLLAAGWMVSTQSLSPRLIGAGANVSGQGKYKFRVLYDSAHLPPQAREAAVLTKAHADGRLD